MSTVTSAPLKWAGGKNYLAKRIVELMPSCLHYVEPYCGGASVLLARNPNGVSEVINDLDGELTNFWKHLQDPLSFEAMRARLTATPFSVNEYDEAAATVALSTSSQLDKAIAFFIHCRQSMAGRCDSFAPLSRTRVRRGMNEQASAWLSAIDGLPAVHERLKRVVVLNRPAVDVIRQQDGKDTLYYVDAPYVHSTRSSTTEYGEFEMTDDQHEELIRVLLDVKGKVVVSMYHHPIYDVLHDKRRWRLVEVELPNNAASGKSKKRMTECLWLNYR